MRNLIIFSFIILVACNPQVPLSQNVVIKGTFLNAHNDTLYLSTLHFDKITGTDTIFFNEKGEFSFEFAPEITHFYVLAGKENNYVRLIIENGEQIKLKADYSNIPATFEIEGSQGSMLLKIIEEKTALAMIVVDSLTKEANKIRTQSDFPQLFPKLDSAYRDNFNQLKKDIKSIIEANMTSLASIVGIYQSLNGQSLFNPADDYELFCQLNDSIINHHPKNTFAHNLQNRVTEMKFKEKEKKRIEKLLQPGRDAAEIYLYDRHGKLTQLSSFKGKVVLLKFWDSHCNICKQENNLLIKIYEKYRNKGFEIISISVDSDKGEWLTYLNSNKLQWTHAWIYDEPQESKSPITQNYFVEEIPVAHLIGKDGKFIVPNIKNNDLEKELEKIFNP